MKIYFFDHDTLSEKRIKSIAQKMKTKKLDVYINDSFANLVEAVDVGEDIVCFIDTRFPAPGGSFAFAKSIREYSAWCHIVFVSAYPEDMIFCFKNLVRPSGFLIKPLNESEVIEIINEITEENKKQKNMQSEKLYISTHDIKKTIKTENIVYFTTSGKKILCKTADGEEVEFYSTIKELEKEYCTSFIRCHSGYLVNKKMISALSKGMILLKESREMLPVSKKYKAVISEFLKSDANM